MEDLEQLETNVVWLLNVISKASYHRLDSSLFKLLLCFIECTKENSIIYNFHVLAAKVVY